MIVVICAAGQGKRLASLNLEMPKPLMMIGGKSLLQRQLDNITRNKDISKIVIVVGYKAEMIEQAIGHSHNGIPVVYAFSEYYWTKGNMSSLWAARGHITEDLVFTVGDLVINAENVRRIMEAGHEASMLVDASAEAKQRPDPLKAKCVDGRVVSLQKRMEAQDIYGAAGGYYKFRLGAARKFYDIIGSHFARGEVDLPFNIPIEELCQAQEVVPVLTDGTFCNDVDEPEDIAAVSAGLKGD